MSFIKTSFNCTSDFADILIAELGELSFDTFEETSDGLDAYIQEELFDQSQIDELLAKYDGLFSANYTTQKIAKENWNEEWEKNYHPIEVDHRCRVRATFHAPNPNFEYEIMVTPKMSFGTGHHATTYNMLRLQLDYDFEGKSVLDLGTGTGILAIMAQKLGADHIEATDIDEWCMENSAENFELNGIPTFYLHKGAVMDVDLKKESYEVVLANINKNVLLEEMPHYSNLLSTQGALFLSGFYENDISDIENAAVEHNLSVVKTVIKDNWAALRLAKY